MRALERQPRVRPGGQPGHEAGRGRRLLLLPARRRRPRPVDDQRAGGRDLPLERRDRRAEAGRLGPAGRAAARRAQRRPRRRHAGDGRGRRARPGAARRGARRLLRADGLPARPHRPVPRARRLRARTSTSTATTWTCAGGPTSRAPGCSWSPTPAPATASGCPSGARTSTCSRCPSVTGCAPRCRRPPASTWSACSVFHVLYTISGHGGRAPHRPGARRCGPCSAPGCGSSSGCRRSSPAAAASRAPARSPTPRWPACRACGARPGCATSAASGRPTGRGGATGCPSSVATCASSSAGRTPGSTSSSGLLVLLVLLVGSRELILSGVPQTGELLAWPAGPVRARARVPGRLVVAGPRRDPAGPDGDGAVRRARPAHVRRQRPAPHAARRRAAVRRRARAVAPRPRHRAEPAAAAGAGRLRRGPAGRQRRRDRLAVGPARLRRAAVDVPRPRPRPRRRALRAPGRPCTGPGGCTCADVVVLGVLAAVVGAFVPVYPALMVGAAAGLRPRLAGRRASGRGAGGCCSAASSPR